MTAPNIVNVSSIVGATTAISLSTTNTTTILSNADASGKLIKVNTLFSVNIDGTNSADITIKYHLSSAGAGTSVPMANTMSVPPDSSLIVVGKDNPIYLEENRSLTAQASAANDIAIICSYEEIS